MPRVKSRENFLSAYQLELHSRPRVAYANADVDISGLRLVPVVNECPHHETTDPHDVGVYFILVEASGVHRREFAREYSRDVGTTESSRASILGRLAKERLVLAWVGWTPTRRLN